MRTGRKLEELALSSKIPKQFLKSPSLTLYRAVIISDKLLDKVHKGKDIVLKNRRYSSWCYTLKAAKEYIENSLDIIEGGAIVILRKKFTKEEILLNVEALGLFLAERGCIHGRYFCFRKRTGDYC